MTRKRKLKISPCVATIMFMFLVAIPIVSFVQAQDTQQFSFVSN